MRQGAGPLLFGPFRLFPDQKLLLEGDAPVRVGSRALDILIALVERAGDLVTKEELLARAWPTTTVDEANLRIHIAGLRKLLGDGQLGGHYIVNVTGRGYRFVASLSHAQEPAPAILPSAAAENAYSLPVHLTRVVGRSDSVARLAAQLPHQ